MGEHAVYLGDAIVHELNVQHPDWLCAFDMDPAATLATRHAVLARAARTGGSVLAFHLAGRGRVAQDDAGYRWHALA